MTYSEDEKIPGTAPVAMTPLDEQGNLVGGEPNKVAKVISNKAGWARAGIAAVLGLVVGTGIAGVKPAPVAGQALVAGSPGSGSSGPSDPTPTPTSTSIPTPTQTPTPTPTPTSVPAPVPMRQSVTNFDWLEVAPVGDPLAQPLGYVTSIAVDVEGRDAHIVGSVTGVEPGTSPSHGMPIVNSTGAALAVTRVTAIREDPSGGVGENYSFACATDSGHSTREQPDSSCVADIQLPGAGQYHFAAVIGPPDSATEVTRVQTDSLQIDF